MQRQIKLKQVQCIIDIILSSDHFSDEEFYNRMGSFPLSQSVKARHIRFLGHCLQHPQEDHISKYALYHPKHCKGRPGGCKIVFHKYAAKLINPENPSVPHEIRTLAQDCKAWKNMEVDCWHHREHERLSRAGREIVAT